MASAISPARRAFLSRIFAAIRALLGWLTLGYGVSLLLLLGALEWLGERFWPFGLLLYAPPHALLFPLIALTPLCLLLRWRLVILHAALAGIFCFVFLTFRWTPEPARTDRSLTAITLNAGDSDAQQFDRFLDAEKPDLILLQDARGLGPNFARKYPNFFVASEDEFVLVSRFPIQKSGVVPGIQTKMGPVAARFAVLCAGQPLVIYDVRMPTPRHELSRFLPTRRLAHELAHPERLDPELEQYRAWLQHRIVLAEALAKVFAAETAPFLVGGDFNTPDHGYIHRLFASEMTDAFSRSGRGWGFTFPCPTRDTRAPFGPWLRIDYFFAGRGWRSTICRPEPGRHSEHKALLARFETQP